MENSGKIYNESSSGKVIRKLFKVLEKWVSFHGDIIYARIKDVSELGDDMLSKIIYVPVRLKYHNKTINYC